VSESRRRRLLVVAYLAVLLGLVVCLAWFIATCGCG
jgi:hypothetical protein